MKRFGYRFSLVTILTGSLILTGNVTFAREKGPPAEVIKGAFRQVLAGADKNGDGKLSMTECMSISSNKKQDRKGLQILGCERGWSYY